MSRFLTRNDENASLENFYSNLSIGLEEEMLLVKDADNEVDQSLVEVEQAESAENVVAAADQTDDMIVKNNGELDENGVIAVDNLTTAASIIATDDGAVNPGDPLNEAETDKLIPVVESSGKYYVSIESFRETFAKIKKKILEIVASIWARIKAAYRKYFGAYTSLMKRAKDIETRADNMSGKIIDSAHKTFEITSGAQYLSLGNTEPTTNAAGVTAALDVVGKIGNKKILTTLKDLGKSLLESVKGADFSTEADKDSAVSTLLTALTKSLTQMGTVGIPDKFIGHTEYSVDITNVASTATPTEELNIILQDRIRINEGDGKLKDSYKFTTMSVSDVKKIASTIHDHAKSLKGYEVGMDELEKTQKDLASASNTLETKANKADSAEDKVEGIVAAYNAIVRSNTYFANNVSSLAKMLKLSTGVLQNSLFWCTKSLDLHKSK